MQRRNFRFHSFNSFQDSFSRRNKSSHTSSSCCVGTRCEILMAWTCLSISFLTVLFSCVCHTSHSFCDLIFFKMRSFLSHTMQSPLPPFKLDLDDARRPTPSTSGKSQRWERNSWLGSLLGSLFLTRMCVYATSPPSDFISPSYAF